MRLAARRRLIFGSMTGIVTLLAGIGVVRALFWLVGRLGIDQTWYDLIGLTAVQLLALGFALVHGLALSILAAFGTFRRIERRPVRWQELTLVGGVAFALLFDLLVSDFPAGLPGLLAVAAIQYVVTWALTLGGRRLYVDRFDPMAFLPPIQEGTASDA